MCVRRYHLCTRKEAQVACRADEGPRRLAPVSAGLLTVGHIGTVGPVGDCRGLPGLGETDGRVGACLGCPVLGLAKALGAGMLGLYHPSRSGAPPKNHSTRLRVLHSRSLVMSCISPERGTKLWPCEGEGRCFSCRGCSFQFTRCMRPWFQSSRSPEPRAFPNGSRVVGRRIGAPDETEPGLSPGSVLRPLVSDQPLGLSLQ